MGDSTNTVDEWVAKLQSRINACENCQPYDDGETVWIAGDSQTVAEFLNENDVPDNLHELVAEELVCGQCSCQLELGTDIVADSIDVQLDESAGERFGWWAVEDLPRLNDFVRHLQESPDSGLQHEVGTDILGQITGLTTRTIAGKWWRARAIKESEPTPTAAQMGPPPTGSLSGGRFNRPRQHVFYLGSDRSAAVQEARKYRQDGEQIWVQRFQLVGADRILELRPPPSPSDIFRHDRIPVLIAGLLWCNGLVQQRQGDEQRAEYLLPQFIAQCATDAGLRGVGFNSLLHDGTNLVLFSWDGTIVTPVGGPERVANPV